MEELPAFLPNAQFEIKHAAALADQLKLDQTRCRENLVPSRLVLVLPKRKSASSLFDAIAWHVTPHEEVPRALRQARCEGIIESITSYWTGLDIRSGADCDDSRLPLGAAHVPKTHELEATLKVLRYLEARASVSSITQGSSFSDVVGAVESHLQMDNIMRNTFHEEAEARRKLSTGRKPSKPRCYMCRRLLSSTGTHNLYSSLCVDCGDFNLSSSNMSQPSNLCLNGKIALVTGGRINLGYQTALRLLRCGAHVIVSSRYPADAASRYALERDFTKWDSRLKIVGADFRTAKDAFRLVRVVKELVRFWCKEMGPGRQESLDILINNAAQTLTDPVRAEAAAISREELLKDHPRTKALIAGQLENRYLPMIRGGMHASWIPSIENSSNNLQVENGTNKPENKAITRKGFHTDNDNDSRKSSWVQTLNQIPYEDLISAHSVNAFVPLILCRELLPCMGSYSPPLLRERPRGYIVNVSSREGIFEDVSDSRSKAGHHVHTNMSKAAINMITETEAGVAWESRHVAMNSVDPGYMSAAPECQPQGGCPIGFEDGAARLLWPIVVGEKEGRVISGRFLKHFEEGAAIIRR
ncbi:hypothetical protein N7532_008653 [Penicillium argentinense]|uniref:Uncharacterized protein n=1 Tax=Penicillium argentinense TaxID=1131581 RepID=A0A9W9K1T4_9EURO|nr:uncharacterized protein N7532_008653 [Penicillium argentinense]KAJ5089969.1 hypothetical protein N7532_008653 [Penicillium argentinense]